MELHELHKAVNKETREIKFFDSQVAIRLFLKNNPGWIYRR